MFRLLSSPARLLLLAALLWPLAGWGQTILPNAQTQFTDSNGTPLAGGSVYFYVPGTTTPKTTWQDSALSVPNTNPVTLNAAGRAQIWGSGLYREIVYDSTGAIVWDQVTSALSLTNLSGVTISNSTINNSTWQNGTIAGATITSSTLFDNASAFAATENYANATLASASVATVLGSVGTPNTTTDPAVVVQKWQGPTTPATEQNAAFYASAWKSSNAPSQNARAIYAEVEDTAGWNGLGQNNFAEGIRSQSTLPVGSSQGSAYGVVAAAGGDLGITFKYMIPFEADVVNQDADAPTTFNQSTFSSAFLASNGCGGCTSKMADAAFLVNQNNTSPFVRGFFVPAASGAAVLKSAFESDETSEWGLQLALAPIGYGAIGLPNNVPIRGEIQGDTGDLQTKNMMFLSTSNALVLGLDTSGVQLGPNAGSLPGVTVLVSGLPQIGVLSRAGTVCIATTGQFYYSATTC